MDGDMVDPPEPREPDVDAELPDGATAPTGQPVGDDAPERASEIDDITDSVRRPAAGSGEAADADDFDAIVGEIDYSDVDVPALLAEREEFKGMAQRIQADFDNYRKRAATQSLAEADRASGRLAEALLPVLDAAEAAFVRHPDEVGPLLNQMLVELKKHGLETLDLQNQPFDPELAEAVAHEPGDGGEPIVAEVLRSGYTYKGRVLRPAMVKTKD
jgi:molecular chaperone GrpE